MPTVKDKADVAAASLRQEIRAAMKGLPRADMAALVNDPASRRRALRTLTPLSIRSSPRCPRGGPCSFAG
jgi:hypothetical protein